MSDAAVQDGAAPAPVIEPDSFVRADGDGGSRLCLLVPDMHCGSCVARIERRLQAMPGVSQARANLTQRQVAIRFAAAQVAPAALVTAIGELGFQPTPYDPALLQSRDSNEERLLLRAMAVAGFAAANVMLLSVSVWSGAASADMDAPTRDLLHWVSALIALPAVAYAGRPFFGAAWRAVTARAMTMDVPIALAVLLASATSLVETIRGGPHAYFDAAVTLLFFLLVGRYLDRRARRRAACAAEHLLLLNAGTATVLEPDGRRRAVPLREVIAGMRLLVAPGEKVPVDGRVVEGRADVDNQLITGETTLQAVGPGDAVHAGTLNRNGALTIEVTAVGDGTLLAEIMTLIRNAEQARGRYVRIADRLARAYSPLVHLLAGATFLGWLTAGADWHAALMTAVAVLIITCPCALALAVPVVQVVATDRLFRRGILVKSPDALERLAQVDRVVFDKTGTLTDGRPMLANAGEIAPADLRLAAALASRSRHPLARALHGLADLPAEDMGDWREVPGRGIEATMDGSPVQLGSREWCGVEDAVEASGPEIWLLRDAGRRRVQFRFADRLRDDAATVVAGLRRRYETEVLSGDSAGVVARAAAALGGIGWRSGRRPADKVRHLQCLAADGHRALMVGDGLNDAAALAAAHVSMAPAEATEASQVSADLVFQGRRLAPVAEALATARQAQRLVRQNFALALAYNLLAVPLAVAGLVTPMIAAIAMSSSSLLVTLNALRLRHGARGIGR